MPRYLLRTICAVAGIVAIPFAGAVSASAAQLAPGCTGTATDVSTLVYHVTHLDGTTTINLGAATAGDTIAVTVQLKAPCTSAVVSAATYIAPNMNLNLNNQTLFDSDTVTLTPGKTAVLTVT